MIDLLYGLWPTMNGEKPSRPQASLSPVSSDAAFENLARFAQPHAETRAQQWLGLLEQSTTEVVGNAFLDAVLVESVELLLLLLLDDRVSTPKALEQLGFDRAA